MTHLRRPGASAMTTSASLYDDLRAALATLAARGLPVVGEPTIRPDSNLKYWASDPDGDRVELTQIMPDSLQVRAMAKLREGAT